MLVNHCCGRRRENDFVHNTSGNTAVDRIQSLGEDVIRLDQFAETIEGRSVDTDRLIFTLDSQQRNGHSEFDLNDQIDHPSCRTTTAKSLAL